jgi:hypothetical protein
VFLLLQHPSSPDGLIPQRMTRYMARIWDYWWGWQRDTPMRLPRIVPLVLSNAERPWSAARNLSDKYPEPRSMMAASRGLPRRSRARHVDVDMSK